MACLRTFVILTSLRLRTCGTKLRFSDLIEGTRLAWIACSDDITTIDRWPSVDIVQLDFHSVCRSFAALRTRRARDLNTLNAPLLVHHTGALPPRRSIRLRVLFHLICELHGRLSVYETNQSSLQHLPLSNSPRPIGTLNVSPPSLVPPFRESKLVWSSVH